MIQIESKIFNNAVCIFAKQEVSLFFWGAGY